MEHLGRTVVATHVISLNPTDLAVQISDKSTN